MPFRAAPCKPPRAHRWTACVLPEPPLLGISKDRPSIDDAREVRWSAGSACRRGPDLAILFLPRCLARRSPELAAPRFAIARSPGNAEAGTGLPAAPACTGFPMPPGALARVLRTLTSPSAHRPRRFDGLDGVLPRGLPVCCNRRRSWGSERFRAGRTTFAATGASPLRAPALRSLSPQRQRRVVARGRNPAPFALGGAIRAARSCLRGSDSPSCASPKRRPPSRAAAFPRPRWHASPRRTVAGPRVHRAPCLPVLLRPGRNVAVPAGSPLARRAVGSAAETAGPAAGVALLPPKRRGDGPPHLVPRRLAPMLHPVESEPRGLPPSLEPYRRPTVAGAPGPVLPWACRCDSGRSLRFGGPSLREVQPAERLECTG